MRHRVPIELSTLDVLRAIGFTYIYWLALCFLAVPAALGIANPDYVFSPHHGGPFAALTVLMLAAPLFGWVLVPVSLGALVVLGPAVGLLARFALRDVTHPLVPMLVFGAIGGAIGFTITWLVVSWVSGWSVLTFDAPAFAIGFGATTAVSVALGWYTAYRRSLRN